MAHGRIVVEYALREPCKAALGLTGLEHVVVSFKGGLGELSTLD